MGIQIYYHLTMADQIIYYIDINSIEVKLTSCSYRIFWTL